MKRITPFLWFDNQAEEAMNFYVSVFGNSKILTVNRAGGRVMSVTFELDGQQFMALNAGPQFRFSEAVSFYVHSESQAEVDEYWDKLSAGGEAGRCGWLKDKFGLSWKIVPSELPRLLNDPDPAKAQAVVDAMMKMSKIVIADLERAHDKQSG